VQFPSAKLLRHFSKFCLLDDALNFLLPCVIIQQNICSVIVIIHPFVRLKWVVGYTASSL